MVRNNLGLGVALAIVVLWWFLRKFRATLLVAVSIPVSLFAAFLCLDFAGTDGQHHFAGGSCVRPSA